MPSQYSINIDISISNELELYEMEEKLYDSCQLIFNNFENITIKINRESSFEIDGYTKSVTEQSIKEVNITKDKYDF